MARIAVGLLAAITLLNSLVISARAEESDNTLTLIYGSYAVYNDNLGNVTFFSAPFPISQGYFPGYEYNYNNSAGPSIQGFKSAGNYLETSQVFVTNYDFSDGDNVKLTLSYGTRRAQVQAPFPITIISDMALQIFYNDGTVDFADSAAVPAWRNTVQHSGSGTTQCVQPDFYYNFTVPEGKTVERIEAQQRFYFESSAGQYFSVGSWFGSLKASLTYTGSYESESLTFLGSIVSFLQQIFSGIINLPNLIRDALASAFQAIESAISNTIAAIAEIPDKIGQKLHDLFVPRDEVIDELTEEFSGVLEAHLGFLYDLISFPDLIKEKLDSYTDYTSGNLPGYSDGSAGVVPTKNGYTFILPALRYSDQNVSFTLWEEQTLNLYTLISRFRAGWIFTLIRFYISIHLILTFLIDMASYISRQLDMRNDVEVLISFLRLIDRFFWIGNPLE